MSWQARSVARQQQVLQDHIRLPFVEVGEQVLGLRG
jgi:hypothetical protein